MNIELIQKAQPGSQEYDELKLKAASGDTQAGRDFVYACVWNKMKKLPQLSERKRHLLFRKMVKMGLVEAHVV